MALLSGGHLATDFAQGALPAMLPFLVVRFDLGYALTAGVMLAATASSSIVQPLFGLLSDRRGALWLLPGGVLCAGVAMGLVGAAPSYALVVVLALLGGLGVAAFHPEGSKFATYASGRDRARGMSYFSLGGNAGFALGSLVVAQFVIWFGLRGSLLAVVPVVLYGLVLLVAHGRMRTLIPSTAAARRNVGVDRRGAIVVFSVVIALRSVAWFALLTFVPLWWTTQGGSRETGSHLLSLMLFAGAVGTLLIGAVADRVGLRRSLLVTQALLGPLVLVFVLVGGAPGIIALAACGMCVVGTFGLSTVLAQQYLPRHVGLASGISVGLAMGVGGVAAVLLGALADTIDLRTALLVAAAAPILGFVLCLRLPADEPHARVRPVGYPATD